MNAAASHALMPPHNIEAEQGVLGSIIIDPQALSQIADVLRPEDFYREAHRLIYAAMMHLYQRREEADFITICDELERSNRLEAVGGPGYITSLVNQVPTSGNAEIYAQIVAQKALFRRLISVAGQLARSAYAEESDALEQAERAIFEAGHTYAHTEAMPIARVLAECLDTLTSVQSHTGAVVGVPTGFRPLDVALGGLQRADLIILAARPGTGKTAFALNIARHAFYEHQRRVLIFSLEMSKAQLGLRLLSMESSIDQQRLRMGWVEDDEWERVVAATEALSRDGLWIEDTSGISLAALRSHARRMQAQEGVDLIIVDYLQLMHATLEGRRYASREQEIAEISRGLKGIAKELNVPVLALAQLSRAVENRQSKIPQLSDLRESGAIENDADVVLFIYREEMYNAEALDAKNTADLIIAKHRNGPVGTVRLGFDASQTRFYEVEYTPPAEAEE